MTESIGPTGPVSPPPAPPPVLLGRRPVPNLLAESARVVRELAAPVVFQPSNPLGRALPSVALPANGLAGDHPPTVADRIDELFGQPNTGSVGGGDGTLGRPLIRRWDGYQLAVSYAGTGASGPAMAHATFLALRGDLGLNATEPVADEPGVTRYSHLGLAAGVDAMDTGGGTQIRAIGVGGRIESGVAMNLGQGNMLSFGAYGDLLSSHQEGGFLLSVRTGP